MLKSQFTARRGSTLKTVIGVEDWVASLERMDGLLLSLDVFDHASRSSGPEKAAARVGQSGAFENRLAGKTFDIRPGAAQIGAGVQSGRGAGSDRGAKGLREISSRSAPPNPGCQKTVSGADALRGVMGSGCARNI